MNNEWQSEVVKSHDYYNSWRKHAQMINSDLMFRDFDEVNVDEGTTSINHTSTLYIYIFYFIHVSIHPLVLQSGIH